MTTYQVGSEGAVVLDSEGKFVFRIRPGYVVIEGTIDTAGSLADQHQKLKRQRGYADKMLRPAEDKA